MFDWILNNKEWLFSGVGIVIAVMVFSWIKKRIKSRKTQEPSLNGASLQTIIDAPPPPKLEPDILTASLSPGKIIEEIKSAPLLQQQEISKQYEGVKVSWKGKLSDAQKLYPEEMIDEKTIRIMISVYDEKNGSDKMGYTSVFFNVDPEQYPGIGLLRKGHELLVEGRIEEISSYIVLKTEKLIFNIDNSV